MDTFAEALRAWRDRISPAEVGLEMGARRRAPGLRREELANLTGVSVDYLIRLEQGRACSPSPQMLSALARALRLSDGERDHLYRLAGLAPPSSKVVSQHIPPGVQRMLGRMNDLPLAVFSAAWDLLWWNPLWAALNGDPSGLGPRDRNVAWRHFTGVRGVMDFDAEHAEHFSDDLAADLREAAGRYPDDEALSALIDELRSESANFNDRWSRAHIARHLSSRKTATETAVGPIVVDCDVLTAPGTDIRIVMFSTEPGSDDESKLGLLRVAGLQGAVSHV